MLHFSPALWLCCLNQLWINIEYACTGSGKGAQKVSAFFAVPDVRGTLKVLR